MWLYLVGLKQDYDLKDLNKCNYNNGAWKKCIFVPRYSVSFFFPFNLFCMEPPVLCTVPLAACASGLMWHWQCPWGNSLQRAQIDSYFVFVEWFKGEAYFLKTCHLLKSIVLICVLVLWFGPYSFQGIRSKVTDQHMIYDLVHDESF